MDSFDLMLCAPVVLLLLAQTVMLGGLCWLVWRLHARPDVVGPREPGAFQPARPRAFARPSPEKRRPVANSDEKAYFQELEERDGR